MNGGSHNSKLHLYIAVCSDGWNNEVWPLESPRVKLMSGVGRRETGTAVPDVGFSSFKTFRSGPDLVIFASFAG